MAKEYKRGLNYLGRGLLLGTHGFSPPNDQMRLHAMTGRKDTFGMLVKKNVDRVLSFQLQFESAVENSTVRNQCNLLLRLNIWRCMWVLEIS